MWHIRLVYISGMGVGVRHRQRDKETEIEKTLPCSLLYYIMTWLSPMGTSDIRVFLVVQQIKEKKNNRKSEMSNACIFLSHGYFKTKTGLSKQENLVSFMCVTATLFQACVQIGSKCFTDRCGGTSKQLLLDKVIYTEV